MPASARARCSVRSAAARPRPRRPCCSVGAIPIRPASTSRSSRSSGRSSRGSIPTAGELPQELAVLGELGIAPGARASADVTATAQRYQLFAAIAATILRAPGRPVVLAVEDLHWADEPTLLFLRYLLRDPELERLLVVGTYRDDELGAGRRGLIDRLAPRTPARARPGRGLRPDRGARDAARDRAPGRGADAREPRPDDRDRDAAATRSSSASCCASSTSSGSRSPTPPSSRRRSGRSPPRACAPS